MNLLIVGLTPFTPMGNNILMDWLACLGVNPSGLSSIFSQYSDARKLDSQIPAAQDILYMSRHVAIPGGPTCARLNH